jgi:hypothetical protein
MRSRLGMLLALRGWFHAGGWFLGSHEDLVKRQPLSAISDSNPSLFPFIHRHATTGRSPVPALPFFGNNASQLLLAFKFVGSWLFRRGLEFVLGHSAVQNTRILASRTVQLFTFADHFGGTKSRSQRDWLKRTERSSDNGRSIDRQ